MKPNANPFRGVVLLICVLALIFCATSIFRTTTHQTTYSYADIRDLFQQEKVETVQVDEGTLTLTLKEPVNGNNVVTYSIYSFQLFYDDFNDIVVQQYEDGIISDYDYPDSPSPAWMSTILTWVIILVVMSLLMYFLFFRRAQGGGGGGPSAAQFGKARARWPRWWTSSASPPSTPSWGPGFPRASSWWALRVPARPSWPGLWPGRPGASTCPSPAPTLWSCT